MLPLKFCEMWADPASEDLRRPWVRAYLAAVGQINCRIEDDQVAPLDAAVDFDLPSGVTRRSLPPRPAIRLR
jgi:hypothetical protein